MYLKFYLALIFTCKILAQSDFKLTPDCQLQASKFFCDPFSRYSQVDGSCNNLAKPWLGKANLHFKRYLPAFYDDNQASPRSKGVSGLPLPNPRVLSRFFSMDSFNFESPYTHLLPIFGQFLAHDFTLSPASVFDSKGSFLNCDCVNLHSECMSIKMPSTENIMRMSCMRFFRTISAAPTLNCLYDKREQVNGLSSFIDGTTIYGATAERTRQLRLMESGLFKTSDPIGSSRRNLPLSNDPCGETGTKCFTAGEDRANENLGITGIHLLFMREHNRIATELARLNPTWNDEKLFQETRKIVIAILQHITYKEWIPTIIGKKFAEASKLLPLTDNTFYLGYDQNVNPSLSNEFATAAFRFGHTLIRNNFGRYDKNNFVVAASVNISKAIFRTVEAFNAPAGGADSIFVGLINEPAMRFDTNIADHLQNHLFEFVFPDNTVQATDLFAANINRGRDHGIPPYTEFRSICGLPEATNFIDLKDVMTIENIQRLASIYQNVKDIDLYVGGLLETPMLEGVVGPTFACIIANQFRELKKGDRFFYENGGLTSSFKLDQLNEIRKFSLARLICNDFDLNFIQLNPFLMPTPVNFKVFCHELPNLDLTKWINA